MTTADRQAVHGAISQLKTSGQLTMQVEVDYNPIYQYVIGLALSPEDAAPILKQEIGDVWQYLIDRFIAEYPNFSIDPDEVKLGVVVDNTI